MFVDFFPLIAYIGLPCSKMGTKPPATSCGHEKDAVNKHVDCFSYGFFLLLHMST